ncbi:MAG TPA: MASE1 domain-containing protein [Gammaproteobacteria bacterium]|nr:MASE1 domain-containing protein [Gammaproteobacteria bacterium]
MRRTKNHLALLLIGYVVVYVLVDRVSYIYPVAPFAITPWNPQTGLALALLLRFGVRFWPLQFAGALAAEWYVRDFQAPLGLILLSCAIMTAGYTAASAVLVGKLRIDPTFTRLRDLNWFMAVVIAFTLPIALSYIMMFLFDGLIPPDEFLMDVLIYWVGDVIGIIVTTPLLLVHWPVTVNALRRLFGSRENIAQIITILCVLWGVFGWNVTDEFKYFYPLFLPLIWIAMRHGLKGATLAILVIQLGLIISVQRSEQRYVTVLELQALMFALAATGLFLGMAVTERQRAESMLSQREVILNRALRFASASEMSSALAHELNQPLSAIGGYVSSCRLLLSARQPERLHDTLEKVTAEVARASQVIHRLRDFYRGGVTKLERITVAELFEGIWSSVIKKAERHGVNLKIQFDDILPEIFQIFIDRIQLETVVHNLVANAIDALVAGPVERREILITVGKDPAGRLRVEVRDTGPGVPMEMQSRLFDVFETTKPEGLGLGLGISRSIIEAHGGKLWLEPTAEGACFIFTLPAATDE